MAVAVSTAESRGPPGTAGEEAVSDVPRAAPAARVGEVRAALGGRRFATATEVVVIEGERLLGVVGIERLLATPDGTPVGDLAVAPAVVAPEVDLEAATRQGAQSAGRSVAVVDAEGRFRGLVPPDRLLQVLELEHEEDLARLGDFLSRVSEARTASEEAVAHARVAGAVAVSLTISCSVASIVAMAFPYALARMGRDPAFGSGPLGHRHAGPAVDPRLLRRRRPPRHLTLS